MQTFEHQLKMSHPINMKAHRAVLAVHSSLVSTEVLDFLHPFHLVLICDRVRGPQPVLVKHHSSHVGWHAEDDPLTSALIAAILGGLVVLTVFGKVIMCLNSHTAA